MKLKRTHVIALTNQKGGCGKTTASVSLSGALVDEGLSVTVVDTDPQCNATDSYGIDRDKLLSDGKMTIADAYISKRSALDLELDFGERFHNRLFVIPGQRGIGTVSNRLETQMQSAIANGEYSDIEADDVKSEHRQRLKYSLAKLRGQRDIVLIDTPPDLGFLMTTALIASDWFIIPVFPSGYDLKGLETLSRNVQKIQERYNPNLRLLGVLLGNADARTKLDSDIQTMLVQKFGREFVFETIINRSVKHREATVFGQTITEHAHGQQPAEQFRHLAREILKRIEGYEQQMENTQVEPELMEVNRG